MAVDVQEPAVVPEPPVGRVLPALDEPQTLTAVAEPKRRGDGSASPKPNAAEDLPAETEAPEPSALAGEEQGETVRGQAMADTLLLRHGRKRLLRSQLERGERWKARLPVAAFKRDRRKRVTL